MELLIQEGEPQQAVLLEEAGFCAPGNAAFYLLDIQEQAGGRGEHRSGAELPGAQVRGGSGLSW